jgi:hypothetical protein
MVKQNKSGLVQREVTVKRGGKSFKQLRWIRPGDDEPEERKGKKEEVKGDSKGKGSYKIGEQFNFLGDKYMKVEKVNESERTVKLSNGLVYTFEAIEAGKKGISGGKYNIGDKVNYTGKEHTITGINQVTGLIELDNMGSISENDLNPKEKTVKDLKPKPKKEVETKQISDKESKVIKGSTKDGSLSAKDRKNADKELQEFIKHEKEQEIKKGISDFDRMSGSAKQYTAGSSFMLTAYLLNDRKKGYDYETRGLKNIDKEEREWYDKKIKLLDEFLDKAPKVETTSYRGMHWDMSDEHESKLYKNFIDEMKVGEVIESKAYSSTTVSKSILSHYSSSRISGIGSSKYAKIEYETKSGVYIASESQTYEQLEVLLPHHTKFEVIKNEIKGNTHIIKLREVS